MIGTRPEAIKLAPVAKALGKRGLEPSLILTGQHPMLEPREFGLGEFPVERLGCPGQEDPHRHVQAVTATLLPRLGPTCALLVVQGDTSSALGAALAGFTADVPVAHVEAGLRTHDPMLPWPEEEYRTAIDAQAELLLAPTEVSAANLRAEHVPGEIHVTGNTSIDAVLALKAKLPASPPPQGDLPRLLVTAHRRESWGEGLRSIAEAMRQLASDSVIDFVLHPNVHVAASMRALLDGHHNIRLVAPCGHRELIRRMCCANLVLSDSGGIQEEAPTLGVPLLVLREKSERPEGIECGSARLAGTSADRIVAEARQLLRCQDSLGAMRRPSSPYGDGKSGPRIAKIIEAWLTRKWGALAD